MTLAVRVSVLADQHAPRFLRFCLVGGSGVVVNMGILALLVSVGGWSPVLAAPVATEAAILNNFAINDRWTFADRRGTYRWYERLLRYNGITIGGLVMDVGFGLYGALMVLAAIQTFRYARARSLDCATRSARKLSSC